MLVTGCPSASPPAPSPAHSASSPSWPGAAPGAVSTPSPLPPLTRRQKRLVKGARGTLGDLYDAGYYAGGPPPKGRGACTDVVYAAFLADGLNLQTEMEKDIARQPDGYPSLRDANIDYRWAPNQIIWFRRHAKELPKDKDFQPGDVVFWNLAGDGVADHVGVISDARGVLGYKVIHNFPPACREDELLFAWKIMGHFRRR